jgi:uncharacterized protein YjbI with pentapeptide repeats
MSPFGASNVSKNRHRYRPYGADRDPSIQSFASQTSRNSSKTKFFSSLLEVQRGNLGCWHDFALFVRTGAFGAAVSRAGLTSAYPVNANLRDADLSQADLSYSDLSGEKDLNCDMCANNAFDWACIRDLSHSATARH